MAKGKVGKTVESLGDYLKEQRVSARLSLRQLAEQAGVSNPYLSQIERGLRKPSAEVLQQIAKALRISAEQLYIRAGILSPDDGVGGSVELAILSDTGLTERQKQSLLDVYASFLALNNVNDSDVEPEAVPDAIDDVVASEIGDVDGVDTGASAATQVSTNITTEG
jgi:transcriptional regulator with XRE-family HTH domain